MSMSSPSGVVARLELARSEFALDVDLTLPGHGVSALFGPSGSGKTTLLRALAGLERGARGRVSVNGEVWQDEGEKGVFVPTHHRALGYVFQEASLLPHLSVRANLEFGQKRIPPGERRVGAKLDLDTVVGWLGLERLLERREVGALSGGERQRVAIGRALLASPRLLLMDEPLSALDAASRQEILPYLERLHDVLEVPLLYVSHAFDEVARLADHVVLLERGRVLASDRLHAIEARLDLPLAQAEQAGATLEATIGEHADADALTRLDFPGGFLWVGRLTRPLGARVRARVLARDVSLALSAAPDSSILNVLPARIEAMAEESAPGRVDLRLRLGETEGNASRLLARITRRSARQLGLAVGQRVYAQIKSVALQRGG